MQLLKHFKELSLHPKNVRELKGLIIELAVQGKLTVKWRAENKRTGSASELLNKIVNEKKKLVKAGIYKAKYDTEFFEPLIKRPPIPSNWEYVPVGSICELLTGATPSKAKSSFFGGDIKWLVSGDIHLEYIFDCEGRITDAGMASSNCKILPVNSILMALNGQGKTRATVALLKTPATCNQSLVAMKPYLDSEVLSEYIYYLLKGKYYQIRDITGQHQRRGLNMTLVSQLPIALPPLEEQKAIIKTIKQLFTEIEALEEHTKERIQVKSDFATSALHRLTHTDKTKQEWAFLQRHFLVYFTEKASVKKLRESILQLALQGKLTAQWRRSNPSVEPASKLLKRIEAEKERLIKEKKIKKEQPLDAIKDDEIPYHLPKGWIWCRFQEALDVRDGTHDSPESYYGSNSYPLVTSKDFKNGAIDFESAKRISESDYKIIIKRSFIEVDDILFSMIGGNIGNQVMVQGDHKFAIKNVALFKYYNKKFVLPHYLKTFTEHIAFTLQNNASGGAQPFVSLTYFRNMLFPLPPVGEQKSITEKVNSLMALCDELEKNIEASQYQIEQFMQSCLKEVLQ